MANEVYNFNIGGVDHAVADAVARQGVAAVFGRVSYDSVSHRINFYGKDDTAMSTVLGYIDASPFIVDGMVSNVSVNDGVLTVTFNTDAGKQPISVDLGDAFSADNYYTKTQIDNAGYVTSQRTLINMDDSDGLVFTDANGDEMTHAQVAALLNDDSVDLVINYDKNGHNYSLELRQREDEGDGNFYYAIQGLCLEAQDAFISVDLYFEDGELYIDTVIINGFYADSSLDSQSSNPVQNHVITTALAGKQNTLTFDNAPTANSNNPVKSGGVYTALAGKQDTISDLATIYSGAAAGATAIQGVIVGGSEVTPDANRKVTIPAGVDGKSAYESYLDTTDDDPVMTEAEWVASLMPTVVANGDMAIVESEDYIDIFIYEASIATSPSVIALDGEAEAHKSATLNVVGSHLKADIVVSVPTGFYIGATGTATSATLTATGGSVDTSVVIRHNGNNPNTDITGVVITLTSGSVTKTVPLSYTRYAGPTIIADSALTINAAAGASNTATLSVSGVNLTGNITAAISGTNASKFSVSGSPITQSGGSASGTLTITYSPSSGDTSAADASAILTLSSTGATSIQVALTGKVSELTVSKQSISINTDQGVVATDTFTVSGVNLTEGVTIAKTDTNGVFSVSPSSITKTVAENSANTITVTYQSANAGTHTGSLTISSGGVTKTVSLSGTAEAVATSDAEGKFTKKDTNGNTLYLKRVLENGVKTTNVEVHQSTYADAWNAADAKSYSGDIVIPQTVVVDGVTCNIVTIAGHAFSGCTGVTSISLPEGITEIGGKALYGLTNQAFTSITIPSTVESIGFNFLSGCTYLETVNMLNAQNEDFVGTSIDGSNRIVFGAQYNTMLGSCPALTGFVLPDKVQLVQASIFSGTPVTGGTVVLGTDLQAFRNMFDTGYMTGVTTIICRGTTTIPKPSLYTEGNYYISSNVYNNATVYVPDGYKSAYAAVAPWSTFNESGRLKEISELPSND